MRVIEDLPEFPAATGGRPTAVTFGVFDGLHLGHQELIGGVVKWAREHSCLASLLTFKQHPLRLLAPVYAPPTLMTLERRLSLFESLGLDLLALVDFDRPFAEQTPEEFVQRVLLDTMGARAVHLGFNNHFGRGGTGDTALLQRLGNQLGFEVAISPPCEWKGSVVSSTRVRQLLADGEIRRVNALLGRPHVLEGEVVRGDARGRSLGFPTANLQCPSDFLIPCTGVYAVRAHRGDETHGGVMNIGNRPTFGELPMSVEVHLLDFKGDLYGKPLAVELLDRLRPEKRFTSGEALIAQIHRDIEGARAVMKREE